MQRSSSAAPIAPNPLGVSRPNSAAASYSSTLPMIIRYGDPFLDLMSETKENLTLKEGCTLQNTTVREADSATLGEPPHAEPSSFHRRVHLRAQPLDRIDRLPPCNESTPKLLPTLLPRTVIDPR
jgi:hypothetical protein